MKKFGYFSSLVMAINLTMGCTDGKPYYNERCWLAETLKLEDSHILLTTDPILRKGIEKKINTELLKTNQRINETRKKLNDMSTQNDAPDIATVIDQLRADIRYKGYLLQVCGELGYYNLEDH